MAEISQVKILDGSVYDLKDTTARDTVNDYGAKMPVTLGVKSVSASGGTVTWTSDSIATDSIVHIYSSVYGMTASGITVASGSLTATFPASSAAYTVNATVNRPNNNIYSGISNSIETILETKTLEAGTTILTWTDASVIGENALIDVYTSSYGITPTSVQQTGSTITVRFPTQSSAIDVCVVVKQKY